MSLGAAVSAGRRKRLHLTATLTGAADNLNPLLTEIQPVITANPSLWGATVYYTGDDNNLNNPLYVYDVDSLSGEVTLLERPLISPNALVDVEKAMAANELTLDWNDHTTIITSAANDIVKVDASINGGMSSVLQCFNATPNILKLQLDATDNPSGSTFDDLIAPNSGFSCRVTKANTVEVMGTGMQMLYSNGVNGYVIQGDIMQQWGSVNVSGTGDQTLAFHTAFGSPPYFIDLSNNMDSTSQDSGSHGIRYASTTNGSFVANIDSSASTGEYRYMAIGQRP